MVLGFRLLKFCDISNISQALYFRLILQLCIFQSKWQSSKWNLSSSRVDKKELTFLFSKTNKQWSVKNKNITHVNQFLLHASWTWVSDYRIWTDIATSPQLYISVFSKLDICLFHYIFPRKGSPNRGSINGGYQRFLKI